MAPVGHLTVYNGPAEIVVGPSNRRRRRRPRHSVVMVMLLSARFSFTTYVASMALWCATTTISIVTLTLHRFDRAARPTEREWSPPAAWVACFAAQQAISMPLAWWRRRTLMRQRAQGRSLVQLDPGTCFLQVHALVSLVGSMGLFAAGALIAIRAEEDEPTSPLRAWQEAATILVGSHFLLPLLAYYSLKLFFPVVIAGMANTGVAPGQTRPSTAGVLRGLAPEVLAALPVTAWGGASYASARSSGTDTGSKPPSPRTAAPGVAPAAGGGGGGGGAGGGGSGGGAGGGGAGGGDGGCGARRGGDDDSGGSGGGEECAACEDEECAICCAEYGAGDQLRRLPCGHSFHKKCIDSWLRMSTRCPMCRHDLSPPTPPCPPCPEPQPGEGSAPPAASLAASRLRRQAPRRPAPTPTLAPMPQPVAPSVESDVATTAAPQYEEAVVVAVPVVTQPEDSRV